MRPSFLSAALRSEPSRISFMRACCFDTPRHSEYSASEPGTRPNRCPILNDNMSNPPLTDRRLFWFCALVGTIGSLLAIGLLEVFVDYSRDVNLWLPLVVAPLITVEILALSLLSRYP